MTYEIKKLEWTYKSGLSGDVRAKGVGDYNYEILVMDDKTIYLRVYHGAMHLKPLTSQSCEDLEGAKSEAWKHHKAAVERYLTVRESD